MRHRQGVAAVVLAGSLGVSLLGGCSTFRGGGRSPTVALEPAPTVPGAEGTVGTATDANGNTRVTVAVRHLAPPDRLGQGAATYVVWARPVAGDAPAQNLGALRVDSDLRGTLETLTPLRSFELMVTAEGNPNALTPSAARVLRAEILSSGR